MKRKQKTKSTNKKKDNFTHIIIKKVKYSKHNVVVINMKLIAKIAINFLSIAI